MIVTDYRTGRQVQVCTKCNEAKPVEDYYVKDKKTGRLYSWCKTCHNAMTLARSKVRYAEDPEPFKAYSKKYAVANKEELKVRRRRYVEANRSKLTEAARAYRAAHPDKVRACKTRYRAKHRDVIAAWNLQDYDRKRAYKLAKHKAWRDANPEKHKAINTKAKHRRRAHKAAAPGSFTAVEWEAVKAAHDYRCLGCGMYEPMVKLTVDHIVPLSKGGSNNVSNLQPLCLPCNSSKQARTVDLRPRSTRLRPNRPRRPI